MKIENNIAQFEPDIARILSALCYHVHPDVISYVQEANSRDRTYFENLFDRRIEADDYMYEGSACVFPGVRRLVNNQGRRGVFNQHEAAILDDNVFPRHIWCFLLNKTAYSGPAWKSSGLGEFELAHVFAHKRTEAKPERQVFGEFDEDLQPFGNFTCAANVVLLPKGTVRPTDNSTLIKNVFYKRHIELYGESTLNGRSHFRDDRLAECYGSLRWNSPVLPDGWRDRVERLMQYRKDRITGIMARADQSQAA